MVMAMNGMAQSQLVALSACSSAGMLTLRSASQMNTPLMTRPAKS
jgi:hypothetical protein